MLSRRKYKRQGIVPKSTIRDPLKGGLISRWNACSQNLNLEAKTLEKHFETLQNLSGEAWGEEDFRGKVTVLSFTDQKSQDLSAKAGSALGKRFMENERFQIATAVKVAGMFKGLAGALLKAGQAKARESAVKKFEKEGKAPPNGLAERIHVLFDLDGNCSKACLTGWKDGQARLVLVDTNGNKIGESCHDDPVAAVDALAPKIEAALNAPL